MDSILHYGLAECDLIKKDNALLQRVFEKTELDHHYRIIEYGDKIKIHKCTFQEFAPLFEKKVNKLTHN